MSLPAIKVEGLWKQYTMGAALQRHDTFYDLLSHALKAPFRRVGKLGGQTETPEQFWALRDVNFEIQPGEVVGVIGRNGAGKSTLLKLLSRITAPTRGRIEVRGRLASLLEVGTGFHAELSGRENIYLNGAILGMSRSEAARKFDEIVAFAEIEKFIDTPVKRYSSGMYVRLAFAVAAYLEPDILVIDEVLAVGDAEFQKKCLGKMDDVRNDGRAVVVVSHNISQLAKICEKAIWLDKGCLISCGNFRDVSDGYMKNKDGSSSVWIPSKNESFDDFYYEEVAVVAPLGSIPESIPASKNFEIRFRFVVGNIKLKFRIALQILDSYGVVVMSSANTDIFAFTHQSWSLGEHVIRCQIPGNLLSPGLYYLNISRPIESGDEVIESVCNFTIDSADSLRDRDGRLGVITPLLDWRVGL